MSPGELHGCSRGIYGLKSWESLRRPHPETLKELGLVISTKWDLDTSGFHKPEKSESSHLPAVKRKLPMLAKYSYTANKNSPLGHELSVKKGDILSFLKAHEENDSWWLAENEDRDVGYVPSSYMMMIDEVTDQSWLQNASQKKEPQKVTNVFGLPTTATGKPYKPTYKHEGLDTVEQNYCKICDKQFNGPKPYRAHMFSRAHREEVERLADYTEG